MFPALFFFSTACYVELENGGCFDCGGSLRSVLAFIVYLLSNGSCLKVNCPGRKFYSRCKACVV